MARSAPHMERERIVRHTSLGVLLAASLLTLGACASETATPAPPAASPAAVETAAPTELPGVIPGETVPAADDAIDEPLPTEAAG
jgi:hypothetical protein